MNEFKRYIDIIQTCVCVCQRLTCDHILFSFWQTIELPSIDRSMNRSIDLICLVNNRVDSIFYFFYTKKNFFFDVFFSSKWFETIDIENQTEQTNKQKNKFQKNFFLIDFLLFAGDLNRRIFFFSSAVTDFIFFSSLLFWFNSKCFDFDFFFLVRYLIKNVPYTLAHHHSQNRY